MWWRALGCEPTDDKETVKSKYAALIKTIDQDTDIDTFTSVHRAYRMAMKSFRDAEKKQKVLDGLIEFEKEGHWYLVELAKIYNNPRRRLKTAAWKNLFACMSFIEEKHFLSEYIHFFNEHYALTKEIWALVERYYPLSTKKEFRWPEIVNGHLGLTEAEISGMTFEEASNYVTYKIHVFYGILDSDYERAMMFLRMLIDRYDRVDLNRWYMVTAIGLGQEEEVKKAYDRMCQDERSRGMADYYYCGYLNSLGDTTGSAGRLRQSPEGLRASALKVLSADHAFAMGAVKNPDLRLLPWKELDSISPKDAKLLAKGNYKKVAGDDGGKKFRLFGGR